MSSSLIDTVKSSVLCTGFGIGELGVVVLIYPIYQPIGNFLSKDKVFK